MNFKRFITVLVLSTLLLGVLAFNTVETGKFADGRGYGKTPTGTKTPARTKTPHLSSNINSNSYAYCHSYYSTGRRKWKS